MAPRRHTILGCTSLWETSGPWDFQWIGQTAEEQSSGVHGEYRGEAKERQTTERIAGVLVIAPAALIASKVIAYQQRRGQPKSGTDWRDLALLLLTFPGLKRDAGPVDDQLHAVGATPEVLAVWHELVAQEIRPAEEDEEF